MLHFCYNIFLCNVHLILKKESIMKIIGITLSNNPNSINRVALESVLSHIGGESIPFSDVDFPLFKVGMDEPEGLQSLCDKITTADKIIFASPEYNGTFSSYGKNVLDWISTKGSFAGGKKTTPLSGKHTMLMAASPGLLGGIRTLPQVTQVLNELGCVLVASTATTGGFKAESYDYSTLYGIAENFKKY